MAVKNLEYRHNGNKILTQVQICFCISTHQLVVCADVNVLGGSIHTTR